MVNHKPGGDLADELGVDVAVRKPFLVVDPDARVAHIVDAPSPQPASIRLRCDVALHLVAKHHESLAVPRTEVLKFSCTVEESGQETIG